MKHAKQDQVVLCFFGDGASNTGNFHESLNMASHLEPAGGLHLREQPLRHVGAVLQGRPRPRTSPIAAAPTACPARVVDGMDVLAVREAVDEAVERAREGEGPTLIECKTYRWYGHSRRDPRATAPRKRSGVERA